IPDISWVASFCSCEQFTEPGDRISVKIINVDARTGTLAASIKALYPDPWMSGELVPGAEYEGRVVRFVERADRCMDQGCFLIEMLPGAFVMLCASGRTLDVGQRIKVAIQESYFSKRAVRVSS